MKILLLVLIPFISVTCVSQQIYPLKKYQFDTTYMVIGLPDLRDNNYKKYAFLLDKPVETEALKNTVVLEKKTDHIFELHGFIIYIIKSKEIVEQFITSPANNSMPINVQFYQ